MVNVTGIVPKYRSLADKLLLAGTGVTISNISSRLLRYTGILNAENPIVAGPTHFGAILNDTQPGVLCDPADIGSFDLRPLDPWILMILDYLQTSLHSIELIISLQLLSPLWLSFRQFRQRCRNFNFNGARGQGVFQEPDIGKRTDQCADPIRVLSCPRALMI